MGWDGMGQKKGMRLLGRECENEINLLQHNLFSSPSPSSSSPARVTTLQSLDASSVFTYNHETAAVPVQCLHGRHADGSIP